MLDKQKLEATVQKAVEGTDLFIVDIKVSKDNNVVVELDSPDGLDIDTCAAITRKIEAEFDRDVEDYELEVGSAGLTSPFKVKGQYIKNIGNEIEVLTTDGRKLRGVLTEVGDEGYTIEIATKVKKEGAKRPVVEMVPETISFANTKKANYLIKF